MHELACVNGIAAAYRLGAEYVKFDNFAEDFFSKYLLLSHGVRYGAEERRRKKKVHKISKLYFLCLSLVYTAVASLPHSPLIMFSLFWLIAL